MNFTKADCNVGKRLQVENKQKGFDFAILFDFHATLMPL